VPDETSDGSDLSPAASEAAAKLSVEAADAGIGAGIPGFDHGKDAAVRTLPSFNQLVRALAELPRLAQRYGDRPEDALALSWVYDATSFADHNEAWAVFRREVSDANWTYWAVAPLHSFSTDRDLLDFGDGVSIRERTAATIREITDWDDAHMDLAADLREPRYPPDWRVWTRSTHIAVLEQSVAKAPDNRVLLGGTGAEVARLDRLLLALRLAAPGDVRAGTTYQGRRGRFRLVGGVSSNFGWVRAGPGEEYRLIGGVVGRARTLFAGLLSFERDDRAKHLNLETALRRFSGTFERPYSGIDQLIDDIICLEAVLTTQVELAFTIAFRISGMLEADDTRRRELFRSLKSFYNTRSRVLHGAKMRQQETDDVNRERDLRDVVRRTLRGLLALIGTEFDPTPEFMKNQLDDVLMKNADRSRLARKLNAAT
jgi:Apea-like HEPN